MADVKKPGGKGGRPDFAEESKQLRALLETFTDEKGAPVYRNQLQAVANRQSRVITVHIEHIAQGTGSAQLAANVQRNTRSYQRLLCNVIDQLLPPPNFADGSALPADDVIDVQLRARQQRAQEIAGGNPAAAAVFPAELTRRYELRIAAGDKFARMPLRKIQSDCVGSFVRCRGIVTRVSDVQPLVRVVAYTCDNCGEEAYQTVDAREFTPLKECPSAKCKADNQKSALNTQTRASKFVKFQEIKLQEDASEVPVGHIPRSLTLHAYGEATRQCVPGDLITVSGIFLPAPHVGGFMRGGGGRGLTTDTYIEVMQLESEKKSYTDMEITDAELEEVEDLAAQKNLYDRLSASIAPEIFGQTNVKKALLLTLVGGVTRTLPDLKIRGDINVLLMGDPGVAKSQLLKHVTRIAPRAVYTNGKGSSGVGLTAAVIRDPTTGDMSLEGGALVLADKGICCIDEFDKMDESDKTAIHEVMEQQSVSIAKAGIITTLNARTAVIAAANPTFGRWNPKISAEANLGLPTALLSRFDLTYVMLDQPDDESDNALARHITHVHMHAAPPAADGLGEAIRPQLLRAYIAEARKKEPFVPPELAAYIVGLYVGLRNDSNQQQQKSAAHHAQQAQWNANYNPRQSFCTARTLLSLLRLSQAMARLHMRDRVERSDVEEADRLYFESKKSGYTAPDKKALADPVSEVYAIVTALHKASDSDEVPLAQVRARCVRKGIDPSAIDQCIEDYDKLGVWTKRGAGDNERIRFTGSDDATQSQS